MSKSTKAGLFFLSFSLLFFGGLLFFLSDQRFKQTCATIPAGSTVDGHPITGLPIDQIIQSLDEIYGSPLSLYYQENEIRLSAADLDMSLIDSDSVRQQINETIETQCQSGVFLQSLFKSAEKNPLIIDVPCHADETSIRAWLQNEIQPRYDSKPIPAQPNIQGIGFYPEQDGLELDLDAAVPLIAEAFCTTDNRTVRLPVSETDAPLPNVENLEIQIRSVIDQYQDPGQITEVYFVDPTNGTRFNIARKDKTDIEPAVSFTAASTIKVPVMISAFIRMTEDPTSFTQRQFELMITESKNDQTDWTMKEFVGGNLAPLTVTEDMRKMGLENTFLAGYFYLGAPLLRDVQTPANQRTDIDLKPDRYNQTTAADMTAMMEGIYHCAKDGTGLLRETFPDEITQRECKIMEQLLKDNKLPYLITAGVPETVTVAHKHGWIEESDGLLHTMSNIGIVYSPNGDYLLSLFTWHPTNLIFENGNKLFSTISTAAYDYFNPNLSYADLPLE